MYKYCILLLIPLIWISCSNHPKEETAKAVESESVQPAKSEADTVQYILKERITYWEASLPELDINSDELINIMVSNAIESLEPRLKYNYSKDTYITIMPAYSNHNNKYDQIRINRKSYSSDGYIHKEDFNGYFYSTDSLLVLTALNNPVKVPLKKDGEYKTFEFIEMEIFDLPTKIIRDPIYVDYIIRNDSLYKMLPICTTIHESKELVAHRKPRPKIYKQV